MSLFPKKKWNIPLNNKVKYAFYLGATLAPLYPTTVVKQLSMTP